MKSEEEIQNEIQEIMCLRKANVAPVYITKFMTKRMPLYIYIYSVISFYAAFPWILFLEI